MKFSQFKDSKNLEQEINECISYLNGFLWFDTQEKKHFILPKLNLIICSGIDIHLFLDVTKEYRSNKKFLTRVAALLYIFIIASILKLRLGRIFLKDIFLKGSNFYPVIIGGNNRLRFVDSSNSNALLIAKNSGSLLFTKNAMRAYCMSCFSDLNIIPKIIPVDDRVYLEKQIEGLAINRIALTDTQTRSINNTLDSFFSRQKDMTRDITLSTFIRYKKYILKFFSASSGSDNIQNMYKDFITVCDKIEQHYGMVNISICPSHGDLNRGNIFLDQNRVLVIDWEYFMYRYAKFDFIIYKYDLRHQPLSAYVKLINGITYSEFNVILFLLEDLFFRVLNFKDDVTDSQLYVETLIDLIDEHLLLDKEK
jgi:hypothetical protein